MSAVNRLWSCSKCRSHCFHLQPGQTRRVELQAIPFMSEPVSFALGAQQVFWFEPAAVVVQAKHDELVAAAPEARRLFLFGPVAVVVQVKHRRVTHQQTARQTFFSLPLAAVCKRESVRYRAQGYGRHIRL